MFESQMGCVKFCSCSLLLTVSCVEVFDYMFADFGISKQKRQVIGIYYNIL